MSNEPQPEQSDDDLSTGLPWPKTWNGAYLFVICSFILWIVLLTALGAYAE